MPQRANHFPGSMLGDSPSVKRVFELIQKASLNDITVCFIGESGTGKELAANLLHNLSPRNCQPFVPVNCGAIPENLIESILFGHEKGAFTGATDHHIGVFEEASGGTLFLDEIGEMPLDLQTRLLRVLESKCVRRIGGKTDIPVDVRLVTATHRDLKQGVAQGYFRQDLFYRLYIFPIYLAPLRERREDILLLAEHFLALLATPGEKFFLSASAKEKLFRHEWRGNIRELKNVIQRTLLLTQGETIEAKDIELTTLLQIQPFVGELKLGEQEKWSIIEALKKFRGNHAQTARHLGIARTTLSSKLKRYQIDPKECY